MRSFVLISLLVLGILPNPADAQDPPKMQFNEVKEIAPGVFFRFSQISATDPKVVFGGSNNIWIVFEDFVLVYDANFPKEAGDVIEAIKKTTTKPIRYVLDSHHHGDHAYGNAVFAKAGATIIGHANCAKWLREKGVKEFTDAGKAPTGRKDIRESTLKIPSIEFTDKLVLDDGTQRAELHFLGHAHTPGDAFLYLPKHKILCTGDACVNGAFNYSGHADTASWIKVMEQAQKLDVKLICPGHGSVATKDVLDKQKRYWVEMRQQVKKGIDASKPIEDIIPSIDMPWYKDWTGVEAKSRLENVRHVHAELTGRVMAWDILRDPAVTEGPSPTKDTPGWTAPRRIVVPGLMPARLAELKRIAPDVEFIPVKTTWDAVKAVAEADAILGFDRAEVVQAGKKLRWVQVGNSLSDKRLVPLVDEMKLVLTDTRPASRLSGEDGPEWQWRLWRENVRRFVAGERLLCVVERRD